MIIIVTTAHKILSIEAAGVQAAREFGNQMTKQVPAISKAVTEASKQLGENAARGLGEGMVKASPDLGKNFGLKAAEKVAEAGPAAKVIAGTLVGIYGVAQLYPIGKEIASNCFPGKEQKALSAERLKSAQQRLDLLDAERAFRQCLINNRLNTDRGNSGLPRVCEDAADALAFLGKYSDVEKAAAYFNKTRK